MRVPTIDQLMPMPRRRKISNVPEVFEGESEIAGELRILKEKANELERRLGIMEEKLNDLSEQFMEEFGEDFEEPEEEEKGK